MRVFRCFTTPLGRRRNPLGGGLSLTLIEKFRIKVLVEAHKRETVPGIGSFGAEAVSVKLRKRTPGIEYYN